VTRLVELDEEEASLVVQAISLARGEDDFTPEEQAKLKGVVEKIAGSSLPEGTTDGTEEGD